MGKICNNILILFFLPIITGILLGLSALPSHFWFICFIVFIPLLIASECTQTTKKPLFIFAIQLLVALIAFYLWTGHWVLQAANLSYLIGLLIVTPFILLVSPFILFKKRGNKFAPVYFVAAWLAGELIQSNFQLGSPFYNLGHILGANPKIIQWFEFTGAAGGTLWILVVNFAFYSFIKTLIKDRKYWIKKGVVALGILLLPMIISITIYYNYKEKGTSSEVMIIHPSTDCFNVKYKVDVFELMDTYLDIMLPKLTDKTSYVILPETSITNGGWVHQLNNNLVIDSFNLKTQQYPNIKLVTGAVTYEEIKNIKEISGYDKQPHIKYSNRYKVWYFTYNSALFIEKNQSVQLRTKQELVPFQEYTPYPTLLPRILPVGVDFQFSTRSKNQNIFTSSKNEKIAALICYESVYGRLYAKYAREGAEAFFELLNEGWYNDPKVPKQFMYMSAMRAIENRRDIAHASNMGISCFINQKGEIIKKLDIKEPGSLIESLHFNKQVTPYGRMGDYLGFISILIIILFVIDFFLPFRKVS
jgi:apolipoprotein N-acyltransferase